MSFESFGLSDHLLRGVLAAGYENPTEIQIKAIPLALSGKDVIGRAQTGTGKTAAFMLPILDRLSAGPQNGGKKKVRALVVTPTRELALQNEQFAIKYGKFMQIKTVATFGGVSIGNQIDALRRGMDMVIATPGRLLDHLNRGTVNLSQVEIVVLDEADRMLDMGFIDQVRRIIQVLPRDRQTMLFSATMPSEIKSLALRYMKDPVTVEAGIARNPAEAINQQVYRIGRENKIDLLIELLKNPEMKSVLVFSRTRHGADRITRRLEHSGVKATAIHSDRSQAQRIRALEGFKRGHCQVLVATDIAARGIDVQGISCVVNFDVPDSPEDYIHRVGRTGRMDNAGDAVTLVAFDEESNLNRVERFIGRELERKEHPNFPAEFKINVPRQHEARAGAQFRTNSGRRFGRKSCRQRVA